MFSENNPPSQPNIEYKRIYSSDIESDTFISPNTFISFPSSYYSEEKHLLQASLFFTTKHSNIDSIHSFDFNKFKRFYNLYLILHHGFYHFRIDSEKNDILILAIKQPRQRHKLISFFQEDNAFVSFQEYLQFKSIISVHLTGSQIHSSIESLDNTIKVIFSNMFQLILPQSKFDLDNAKIILDFFELNNTNKPFHNTSYFINAKNDFTINNPELDLDLLLQNYKNHYNNVINLNKKENINKFKIAKNEYENLFLKSSGKMIYIMGPLRLDIMLNLFLTDHNEKGYLFLSACYVDCSKFNSKFDKMIKPIFSTNTQVQKTTSKTSGSGDLTEQLKTLNELYKSGALTKEEFEKAKKKLLN